jgi:hypothetical protein
VQRVNGVPRTTTVAAADLQHTTARRCRARKHCTLNAALLSRRIACLSALRAVPRKKRTNIKHDDSTMGEADRDKPSEETKCGRRTRPCTDSGSRRSLLGRWAIASAWV